LRNTLSYISLFVVLFFIGRNQLSAKSTDELRHNIQIIFPYAAWADQHTVQIPIEFVGRLPCVRASIDTTSGLFIFDTGASDLILNDSYFGDHSRQSASLSAGSTGQIIEYGHEKIDSLTSNGFIFKKLTGKLINLTHIETSKNTRILGILGYDVYRDFEVFIDYPFRQIILTRLDKKGKRIFRRGIIELPSDSVEFSLHKHVIVLDGSVNGKRLKWSIDTGAEVNLLDKRVNRRVLDNFEIIRRAILMGVGNKKVEVIAGRLDGVNCGHGQTYPMRTLLTSTDYIREMTNIRVDGVLGYEYLYTKRISINYKTKKLFFYKHAILKP